MKWFYLKIFLAVFWLGILTPSGWASQVNWFSKPFSVHQTSEGTALDESFIFEVGAFSSGFTPSSTNTADWAAHWNVADRSVYNVTNQVFGGTSNVENNTSPFSTTERGYIWGYSTSGPHEWILISDSSWLWPDVTDTLAFPPQWTVRGANQIVVGQVDPTENTFFVRTAPILDGEPPRLTGDQWLVANFSAAQLTDPAISGWEQDPDGDGLTNLVEMALGANPLVGSQEKLPTVKLVRVGALDHLQLDLQKLPGVTISYVVEVTNDFQNWIGGPLVTKTLVDTPTRLVVRDLSPITFLDSRFLRLNAQLQD